MIRLLLVALFLCPTLLLAKTPSAETVDKLVERIRAELPEGWVVHYDAGERWLEVRRKGKVAGQHVAPSDTPFREPETVEYQFAFRAAPALSMEDFARLNAENAKVAQEAERLTSQLEKLGLRSQKGGKFDAQTEQQQALVAQLEEVEKKWTLPPDFYFENISLTKTKNLPIALDDDKLQHECDEVKAEVEGLLQRYVPKAGN